MNRDKSTVGAMGLGTLGERLQEALEQEEAPAMTQGSIIPLPLPSD
jgi:hypothetical protein